MSDTDQLFVQATDDLIALYRSVERKTLDLPLVSVWPLLIFFWGVIKFEFFLLVGIVLIIPINLCIFVRNLFPGRWRYRPFFLKQLHYVWLWLWRGEAPAPPTVFVRPLLNLFIRQHFERRLRRLRSEILLADGLADTTRTALLNRLDAALERWNVPRFTTIFYTVLLPGLVSLPTWYKQIIEFVESLGIRLPTDTLVKFISENISATAAAYLALITFGYLAGILATSFMVKRGLFKGLATERAYFPGEQQGPGAIYLKEQQILRSVGLRIHEAPADLWILAVSTVVSVIFFQFAGDAMHTWMYGWMDTWMKSLAPADVVIPPQPPVASQLWMTNITLVLSLCLLVFAAVRRAKTSRV